MIQSKCSCIRNRNAALGFPTRYRAERSTGEDCDSVKVFLYSKSQCSSGFPDFHWNKVELTRLTHSLGQMLRGFCLSWAKHKSLMHADLYRVASSSLFRIGLRLPSNTSLSCSFSRGVLTASVFVVHPDSLMMSGACLKSGSMSKCCPV